MIRILFSLISCLPALPKRREEVLDGNFFPLAKNPSASFLSVCFEKVFVPIHDFYLDYPPDRQP